MLLYHSKKISIFPKGKVTHDFSPKITISFKFVLIWILLSLFFFERGFDMMLDDVLARKKCCFTIVKKLAFFQRVKKPMILDQKLKFPSIFF